MANKRLNILSVEQHPEDHSIKRSLPSRINRKQEMEARFERLWLLDPEQFNPQRNCLQQERIHRTWNLLTAHVSLSEKEAVDLGFGYGVLSRKMQEAGAHVTAVDIASNALKHFKHYKLDHVKLIQDAMPTTHLPDDSFNIVVCTELIAEMLPQDYRLFFAELSRLVKADGHVLCSSPIDIYTVGAVQRLFSLASTEFEIEETVYSYFALYLRLKHLLQAPSRFVEGWKSPIYRKKELSQRIGISRLLFWLNTSVGCIGFWMLIQWICKPLLTLLKNNRSLLITLEKIAYFFGEENQISHVIFLAKRRPLAPVEQPNDMPIERKGKKEVWE